MSLVEVRALCKKCGYTQGVETETVLKKLVCPHCGNKGFVDNGLIRHLHGYNPKTGRSYLGEHIDRQTPFGSK